MTRLKERDICNISSRLEAYDRELLSKTGHTLFGIACHACGREEISLAPRVTSFTIDVIPITSGQGIISNFSETIAAILTFLGFTARVAGKTDTSGIANAYENGADAIMMADDERFVGIHLARRRVVDNSEATGRVFAAVLDLMSRGIKDRNVLVMGCGPVGESAARTLLAYQARVALYDIRPSAAQSLKNRLSAHGSGKKITIEENSIPGPSKYGYVLEATPSSNTLPDQWISPDMVVAAPGVPLGISKTGCRLLKDRLVHDKLELGVAAMAVSLVP